MKRWHRISFALLGLVLSAPAFAAVLVVFGLVVILSGFQGSFVDAVIALASGGTGKNVLVTSFLLALLFYVLSFLYMLLQFARARAFPIFLQLYCLLFVIGALFERIRLVLAGDERGAHFWFGLLSLPHALVLLTLILLNNRLANRLEATVE